VTKMKANIAMLGFYVALEARRHWESKESQQSAFALRQTGTNVLIKLKFGVCVTYKRIFRFPRDSWNYGAKNHKTEAEDA